MIAKARASARAYLADSLLRNGIYIMGMTAVTSLLGLGFWVIAARVLPTAEVGRSAAIVSAILFTSVFTNLGIGQVLVSRLSSRTAGAEWSLTVTTALATTAIVSLAGGVLTALLLPVLIPELRDAIHIAVFLMIPLGVAATACSLVLDFACIAEKQAKHALVRNSVAAVGRLALIGLVDVVPVDGTEWLVAIWVGSFLVIDVTGMLRVLPALGHDFAPTLDGWRQELREVRGLIAGHQSINVGAQASTYVLPIVVSAQLGATDNAYFYTSFMVATAVFFIAPAISNSLFAEGAHDPGALADDLRRAARYIATLALPIALVLLLVGPQILRIFGPEYAEEGETVLRLLVLSAAFDAVWQVCLALLRVRHRLRDAASATWLMLTISTGAAWFLLPPLGIAGAGLGWGIGKLAGMCAGLYLVRQHPDPLGAPDVPRTLGETAVEERL